MILIPREYENVWITYMAKIRTGPYRERVIMEQVTRMSFYTKSSGYYDNTDAWINAPDGYFCVPQFWQNFTFSDGSVALLPHTFYSYGRVDPKDVIDIKKA